MWVHVAQWQKQKIVLPNAGLVQALLEVLYLARGVGYTQMFGARQGVRFPSHLLPLHTVRTLAALLLV